MYSYHRELGSFYVYALEFLRSLGVQPVTEDNDMQVEALLQHLDKLETDFRISVQFIQQIAEEARKQFDIALEFFQLDGFTSAHVDLKLEISRLLDVQSHFCPFETLTLQR